MVERSSNGQSKSAAARTNDQELIKKKGNTLEIFFSKDQTQVKPLEPAKKRAIP